MPAKKTAKRPPGRPHGSKDSAPRTRRKDTGGRIGTRVSVATMSQLDDLTRFGRTLREVIETAVAAHHAHITRKSSR
jgi:hypothetical protein